MAVHDNVATLNQTRDKPVAVDLFCGSGAVTLGLKQAGFRVTTSIDIDPTACATYRKNHPEVRLLEQDIRQLTPDKLSQKLTGSIDLLVVCAPCQPFSSRNSNRSKNDSRSELVLDALRFIPSLDPALILFENVPGLEGGSIYCELVEKLHSLSYATSEAVILDAAILGIPQRRKRMILLASKIGPAINLQLELSSQPRRSVRDVIGDLDQPPVGKIGTNANDLLHFARKHHPITFERLKHIPKNGGSRSSLPNHLVLTCHRDQSKNSFPDSYGRMSWDDIAPTLTTGCTDLTKGRYAHPEDDRAITLREAARIQSFPDDYIFCGTATQIATQIGNAVPPEMARQLGLLLKTELCVTEAT